MFEVIVAWYFVVVMRSDPHVIGPFSTESQCQKTAHWIGRTSLAVVSECWYGPSLTAVREREKKVP